MFIWGLLFLKVSKIDERKIKDLARNPKIYEMIRDSIIPSLYGHEDIKEALSLQLFGGVTKEIKNVNNIHGGINILIVGDPGIGKTHILEGASKLALNGVFLDCNKGYATDSEDNLKEYNLQSIIRDTRNCEETLVCLDEMVIKPEATITLKEVIGKKTAFNTKEEVLNLLNSNFPILAAIKPKYGRFDIYKPILEQIVLPSDVLACFDLIYTVEDRPQKQKDKEIANFILKFHQDNQIKTEIDFDLLRKYISYAGKIQPKLTNEAADLIQEYYIILRNSEEYEYEWLVPITTRQLESLVKLSEASARIRLSKEITIIDVKRVLRMYCRCIKTMGYEPENCIHDTTFFIEGKSEVDTKKVFDLIRLTAERSLGYASINVIVSEINTKLGLSQSQAEKIITKLKRKGAIYEPQKGYLKVV